MWSPTKTGLPFESTRDIEGTNSLPAEGLSDISITSMLLNPVNSSVWVLTETPSTISSSLTLPDVSEIIGLVYGSHEAIFIPSSKEALFFTSKVAPYGTLYCSVIFPWESVIVHIVFLETTTCSLSLLATVFISSEKDTIPAPLLKIALSSDELDAAPPIWNVLIVNCVPGSPIDWAATTPTASPLWTKCPLARSLP